MLGERRTGHITGGAQLLGAGRRRECALLFGGSADSYRRMLRRDDIDLVHVGTPREFHHRNGRAALLSGKHAVVQPPLCFSRPCKRAAGLRARHDGPPCRTNDLGGGVTGSARRR
ncbi:hypothetical protein GCM10010365_16010 [Streptomyces poonensis]|uniref:Uncharacterized protein n=1 Tax=Streptomyces poonensis TaxID=68255 RepID=A0A918UF19_9ACTN|nr:hypothetical protein GCM10010365_16010 [Streptomyces poonensis]